MDPLGNITDWIAAYGMLGLFAIALTERFMPLLPSHGVLVAIGIAAAGGSWSMPIAVIATGLGSLSGCLLLYALGSTLGEARSTGLLHRVGRLFGLSASRIEQMILSFRSRQALLAFASQLVPTVRLMAPLIAGLLEADPRPFTVATTAGILIWNGLFIMVGYLAAGLAPDLSASVIALKVVILLVIAEGLLALLWRGVLNMRRCWQITRAEGR